MEYKLELRPTVRKKGGKYKTILLTDKQVHTAMMRTGSPGKSISKSLETNQPGRIYSPIEKQENLFNESPLEILDRLKNDPTILKMVLDYQKQGYEVTVQFPKSLLPVYAGKDTIEFFESKNGKRLIRGLAKEKQVD